jgi:hypothetical protein
MADVLDDPLEPLIREIAAKHGVAVSRDDPLLILQTVFRHLMAEGSEATKELLEHHKEEMEGVSLRWQVDAQGKAERVLSAALVDSKELVAQVMQEGAKLAVASVRSELDAARAGIAQERLVTRRYSLYAIGASLFTSAVVILSLAVWLVWK